MTRKLSSAALCAFAVAALFFAAHAENAAAPTAEPRGAKKAFGTIKTPPALPPQAIGRYNLGCVAGAQRIAMNGDGWQAMRLSRNRYWGHPALISYIETLARDVKRLDGLPGILVGDMAQPIGGPLPGSHASHQSGIDVDLWYNIMPTRTLSAEDREKFAATNYVDQATLAVDSARWTDAQTKLVKRAASYPEVARIFVHPAIKKALCDSAGSDRAWLNKIRPWYKHDDHLHVRLSCPAGSNGCVSQPAIKADDGCGEELDAWFRKLRAPRPKPPKPPKPQPKPKPMLVTDLPGECQALLQMAESAEKAKAAAAR
ncbi:penicillin-insensitive murein endopeptidase [Rhodomicrobium sp. Az07]|uniref:penicillin-insensitive murein endopeptidase n=1 Tax=Rhodomicrobium sp. Az07 TaxID=2839034 RepID=UPI001BE65EBB|nr:penicillin-insensitive murein endopeptidase [Rhodomicrobium sp. Az07]MBT3069633.1 penicillin-insensitive murein endopeptidase [Rhodomicrobium sp. Az07]